MSSEVELYNFCLFLVVFPDVGEKELGLKNDFTSSP